MDISQPDISLTSEQRWKAPYLQFQKQLEDRLNEVKADLVERPVLWLAIAFIAGVVSRTFPVRSTLSSGAPTNLLVGGTGNSADGGNQNQRFVFRFSTERGDGYRAAMTWSLFLPLILIVLVLVLCCRRAARATTS